MSILGAIGGVIGAGLDFLGGKSQQEEAYEQQKEFAQKGIQWRVKDAQKAGIHPLYALGAQTHSFSPTTVGTDFSSVGQNLGGAIDATRNPAQRSSAVQKTMEDLQLTRMGLENDLLRTQIASSAVATTRQAGRSAPMAAPGQPFLVDGQAQSGLVQVNPQDRVASSPGSPHQEPAAVSDRSYVITDTGGLAPVYSTDAKQRLEDDTGGMIEWNVRNRLLPRVALPASSTKVPYDPPAGKHWVFDAVTGEYHLRSHSRSPRDYGRFAN